MSKGTRRKRVRTAKKSKGIVVIKGEQYYSDIPPASQASHMFRDMKAETGIFKGWRKHPTRWPVYHNGVKIYYH